MKGPLRVRIPRPRRFPWTAGWLSGAVFALGTLAGADTKIYRYEDAQGVTVFSDLPGSVRQEVALAGVNTYTPAESRASVSAPHRAAADATESYRSLLVTGPGDGETIRHNGGIVRVLGRVEPALREGHRAVLLVDGAMTSRESHQGRVRSPTETHADVEFALEGVARGHHTLRIAIVDRGNNVLIESSPVSFHLLRAATGQRR